MSIIMIVIVSWLCYQSKAWGMTFEATLLLLQRQPQADNQFMHLRNLKPDIPLLYCITASLLCYQKACLKYLFFALKKFFKTLPPLLQCNMLRYWNHYLWKSKRECCHSSVADEAHHKLFLTPSLSTTASLWTLLMYVRSKSVDIYKITMDDP